MSLTESENERLSQEYNALERQLKAALKQLKEQNKDSETTKANSSQIELELANLKAEKEVFI